MIGFIIFCIVSCLFIGIGISAFLSKEPVGFWNIKKMGEVTDIKKYNFAVGKMWCIFGVIFLGLGIPLLADQNSPIIMLSEIGVMVWVIALMAVYELGIIRKYRKK